MKLKKFLALMLLIPLSFICFACKPDTTKAMTLEEIKQSVMLAEKNSEIEVSLNYEIIKGIDNQKQSQSDCIDGIIFSKDNANFSIKSDEVEDYFYNGYKYTKRQDGEYDLLSKDENTKYLNDSFSNMLLKHIELNLNKDYLTLSSVVAQDGYKVNICFDLKNLMNNIISNIDSNKDKKLSVMLDQLLSDLGYNITTAELLNDLKSSVDENTTIKSLIEHYSEKFDINYDLLINVLEMVSMPYKYHRAGSNDDFDLVSWGFHSSLEQFDNKVLGGFSQKEFNDEIDRISTYLNDDEVTLSILMEQADVESPTAFFQAFLIFYNNSDKISVNNLKFEAELIFKENKTLKTMNVNFAGGISFKESNQTNLYELNAGLNATFNNIGTTNVVLPEEIQFKEFTLYLTINKDELVKNCPATLIVGNEFVPSFTVEINEVVYARYNSQNKILILTADAINEYFTELENDYEAEAIEIYDFENDIYVFITIV